MSLRRVVEDLLGADGSGTDGIAPGEDRAAAALEAAGHGGLGSELYGEALLHFADTAPLEQADALSPIVTAASAVPLDPELDPLLPEGTTIDDIGPATQGADEPDEPDLGTEDPDLLDSGLIEGSDPTVDQAAPLVDRLDTDEFDLSGSAPSADGFGAGAANPPTAAASSDAVDGIGDDGIDGDLDGVASLAPGIDEPGVDAAPDPLDPFETAATDGSDGADLLEGLVVIDEPGDVDPDLLLDE